MGKETREKRNKLSKTTDLNIPITIDIIGTNDDPCFGKLYSPKAEECSRCGDSEICSIVMGQLNHLKRGEQEKKEKFKDMEETTIPQNPKKENLKKLIKNRIRKMVKMGGEAGVQKSLVVEDIYASYNKDGYDKTKIEKMITKVVSTSDKITLTKNKLNWKH